MKHVYAVSGMHCASCEEKIAAALGKVPGITSVRADFASRTAAVEMSEHVALDRLNAAMPQGYRLSEEALTPAPAPAGEKESFLPLILIVAGIAAFAAARHFLRAVPDWHAAMYDFMAAFFLVFGGFKLLDLKGFADAYQTYDVIARKSRAYALVYPFLEIGLGALYLTRQALDFANPAALVLMSAGSIGVFRALAKKQKIRCACLGTRIKLPMTVVTLLEDILMAGMALVMIIR